MDLVATSQSTALQVHNAMSCSFPPLIASQESDMNGEEEATDFRGPPIDAHPKRVQDALGIPLIGPLRIGPHQAIVVGLPNDS